MSLRLTSIGRSSARNTYRTRLAQRLTCVRFSQCLRLHETASPAPEQPLKDLHHGQQQRQQRKSSIKFPALALFALAIPVGWYLLPEYYQSGLASRHDFVPYTLIAKTPVSSTSSIFALKPASSTSLDLYDPAVERALTSVEFKQPQLQIARSYTLLPQQVGQHEDEVRFLIRREEKGEVSNFLHRLSVGSRVEVRGLRKEFVLPEGVRSVVFLAGGTGIAPALQVCDLVGEEGQGRVHVLWATRRREECVGGSNDTVKEEKGKWWWPWRGVGVNQEMVDDEQEKGVLVRMLEDMKSEARTRDGEQSRILVDYYIDEKGTFIEPEDVEAALNRLQSSHDDKVTGKNVLIVSGPDGFVNYWAGPKQWMNGREVQGPLRGVLSTLKLDDWVVFKL